MEEVTLAINSAVSRLRLTALAISSSVRSPVKAAAAVLLIMFCTVLGRNFFTVFPSASVTSNSTPIFSPIVPITVSIPAARLPVTNASVIDSPYIAALVAASAPATTI